MRGDENCSLPTLSLTPPFNPCHHRQTATFAFLLPFITLVCGMSNPSLPPSLPPSLHPLSVRTAKRTRTGPSDGKRRSRGRRRWRDVVAFHSLLLPAAAAAAAAGVWKRRRRLLWRQKGIGKAPPFLRVLPVALRDVEWGRLLVLLYLSLPCALILVVWLSGCL